MRIKKNGEILWRVLETWEETFGDRTQELVFIGKNLEEMKWRRKLDELLLHDEELALGKEYWMNFLNDPFKEYIPNR